MSSHKVVSITMRTNIFVLLACSIAMFFGLTAQSSAAKLKAQTKVIVTGTSAQLQVTLTSTKALARAKRPSKLSVRAAGKSLKLAKVKAPAPAKGYSSSWQSKSFTGSFAEKLKALGGKKLKITAKARSGSVTLKSKATVESPAAGGGGGGGPAFPAPGRELTGMEAYNHLSPYLMNSAFSDCAAGPWPKCAVEHRYVHCPNFSWRYMRTSGYGGSDINAYDNFTVSGATVHADGSWAVSYTTGTGGNYVWQVAINGVVGGSYQFGANPVENLGVLYWSQPAIAWDQLSGAC